ncbi:LysR family transcriptional regulator [Petralouisia muris]|uniref:LysR family transcriptional regulator n=1 Tax=Petralouisia muris TaxID=3032872 RepID=A0AC61RU64_9FIRM|nr:LysR family transcriptional regulator [Petralouisia muris]TGY95220.1 LysR family transcriptional regulator [Petralouisia muris]
MDLDRVAEFVAIAQHQSIKKAAEALQIVPATLNTRFRAFESSLGIRLFLKEQNKLTLTAEGSCFYADALKILKEYRQLQQELSNLKKSSASQGLCIAITGNGLPFHLGPFLDILNAKNPQIQIRLLDDACYSIADGLLSNQIDLYFASAMNQFTLEGITKYTFAPSQQYVMLPARHKFSTRESISLKELDGECFILYPETRETCIRDFQLANLQAANIHYTVYDSQSSVIFNQLFVPVGKGLFLSPVPLIDALPNTACILLTDIPYPASSSLFYCRDCSKPHVMQFVEEFKQFIREAQRHENRKAL